MPSWAAACGVNVVRAAHAELIVTDLDRAADFYGGLLGFVETERDAEALYYRGYEEREHHSLILRRGARPAVSHIAFRIARPDDLAVLEERFRDKGLPVRRIPAGEERGQGAAVRVQDPCGLPVELYHEMETVGRRLQQYHLHRGAPIMRLDHFNCQVPDVASATDWYMSELGFGLIEYTEADNAAHDLWAAWLRRKHSVHDLAVMNGVGPRLHHVGFSVPDALAVLRACDVLAAAGADPAARRQRLDGAAHRGGAPQPDRPGRSPLPAGDARRRPRAHTPLPGGVGRRVQLVRRAPGALRALLLRRPGAYDERPLQRLRQGALDGPRQSVPGPRRRAVIQQSAAVSLT